MVEAQPGLAVTTSLFSDINTSIPKPALEGRVRWEFWLSYIPFLWERSLRPSLAQLVKEGDLEQERKLTGDRGITAVCYLTPEKSKNESSGK